MNTLFVRRFVPPMAAMIGIGIGYLSAGTGKDRTESQTTPVTSAAPVSFQDAEVPYPATMEGAVQAASENLGTRREWLLEVLAAKMTAAELEATANRVETLIRSDQYVILPRIMAAWAALDPEAAERWLIQHAPTFRKGAMTFMVSLDAFAKKQPQRAFAMIDQLPEGVRRERMATAAAKEMAKINPRAAAELAATLTDPKARKLAEAGVLTGLAFVDPIAALARLKELPDDQRSSLVSSALDSLFAQSPAMGFDELSKLPANEQSQHMYTLAWRYADRAPQFFADYVEKNAKAGDASNVSSIAHYAATAMASSDPAKAMEWAKRLPANSHGSAVNGVLNTWSQKDPAGAMVWALKNKPETPAGGQGRIYYGGDYDGEYYDGGSAPSDSPNRNVSAVLQSWAYSDPAAMKAWANTPEGAPYRQEVAMMTLGPVIAEGRLDEARTILSQLPAEKQQSAIQRTIGTIVQSNPAKAAEWLVSLPVNDRSAGLYQSVVHTWASTDITAAAAWIEKLPESPARDSAALAYAQRISGPDPSAAMEWALSTAAGDARRNALATIYLQWERKQPAAAGEWLQNTAALSAEEASYFKARKQ